jgi:hypothetical protein
MAQVFDIFVDFAHFGYSDADDFDQESYEDEKSEQYSKVMKYLEEQVRNTGKVRRGDIIQTIPSKERYRNTGTLIWNGYNLLALEAEIEIDDYGFVPREFAVSDTNFSPDWWSKAVCHNDIFWPDMEIRKRAVASVQLIGDRYEATFFIGNKEYHLCNSDEDASDVLTFKGIILDSTKPFEIINEDEWENLGFDLEDYPEETNWIKVRI